MCYMYQSNLERQCGLSNICVRVRLRFGLYVCESVLVRVCATTAQNVRSRFMRTTLVTD